MAEGALRISYGNASEGKPDDAPTEATLEALCAAVELVTREVVWSRSAFVRFLGESERGPSLVLGFAAEEEERAPIVEALAELRLVGALGAGDERAARAIDDRYIRGLEASLATMRLGDATVEDVIQRVREKLLVRDPSGRARIADYAGQGRLRALVQVVATREALDVARRKDPLDAGDDDLLALPAAEADPELAALSARFGADFRAAFEASVRSLTSRERNLLRMHVVAGAPLERLATMYGAHRATIVRWLAAARASVLKATRTELRTRTGATNREIDEMLELVRSRLDLSLERWFNSTAAEVEPPDDAHKA